MAGYTKLSATIIGSTIWRETASTRLVWITMLALKDRDGLVMCSVPGLADFARVSLEECEAALETLSSPDRYSRTKTHEGRRIAEIDGGWVVLNHDKYRNLLSEEDKREKARARKQRQRDQAGQSVTKRDQAGQSVTKRDQAGQSVTKRDQAGQSVTVTPCPAMSRHTDTDPNADPKTRSENPPNGGSSSSAEPKPDLAALTREVFEHWRTTLDHPKAKLTPDKRGKIQARLREGFSVDELKAAIDGCSRSSHHMGQNDAGKRYDSLDLICRNGSQVEKFHGYLDTRPPPTARRGPVSNYRLQPNHGKTGFESVGSS